MSEYVDLLNLDLRVQKAHVTRQWWRTVWPDCPQEEYWRTEANWSFNAGACTNPMIPATHMSHPEALDWIARLNAIDGTNWRLPTVDEARAIAMTGQDVTTMDAETIRRQATVYENCGGVICSVARREPTPAGLYDVIGLVYTWCDNIDETASYSRAQTSGGSWSHSAEYCGTIPTYLRARQVRSDMIGLRLVAKLRRG